MANRDYSNILPSGYRETNSWGNRFPPVKGASDPNAVKLSPRYVIESPCKHDIEWV
jgi:hypothetical protein